MTSDPMQRELQPAEVEELGATCQNKNTSFRFGTGVKFGRGVAFGPNCETITIGAGAFIGNDVYIDVKKLTIGDYFTLHQGSVIHGEICIFGHNCWIGQYTILDGHGGLLQVGNNVGIGAHSQLWSHMKFGDVMDGCRWHSMSSLTVDDDVWFVGHCIVSPIHAAERSMLLVGGVATKDMAANHVYAGSPAKDITATAGYQFDEVEPGVRTSRFESLIEEAQAQGFDTSFVQVIAGSSEFDSDSSATQFCPEDRLYQPRYSEKEMTFMKQFLLYDRAKFCPHV